MKTTRLLIIISASAALMGAAPAANARPAMDAPGARTAISKAATPASIALHHEQMSQQQYLASHGTGAATAAEPLVDGTDTDNQFPLVFVIVGISIPLALGLAAIVARPFCAYARHRRPPASAA